MLFESRPHQDVSNNSLTPFQSHTATSGKLGKIKHQIKYNKHWPAAASGWLSASGWVAGTTSGWLSYKGNSKAKQKLLWNKKVTLKHQFWPASDGIDWWQSSKHNVSAQRMESSSAAAAPARSFKAPALSGVHVNVPAARASRTWRASWTSSGPWDSAIVSSV